LLISISNIGLIWEIKNFAVLQYALFGAEKPYKKMQFLAFYAISKYFFLNHKNYANFKLLLFAFQEKF